MARKPIFTDDEIEHTPRSEPGVTRPVGPGPSDDAPETRITGSESAHEAPETRIPDAHPADDSAETYIRDMETSEPEPQVAEQPAAGGIDAHGHARPATRIHGYGTAASEEPEQAETDAPSVQEVVGWLVILKGPGRGAAVTLSIGMNAVGRGPDNQAQVDFGDETISRDAHAFIVYDNEKREFHVAHAGKTNLVRRNDEPVLTTVRLEDGDTIRIGETAMKFVAFCGPHFDWAES